MCSLPTLIMHYHITCLEATQGCTFHHTQHTLQISFFKLLLFMTHPGHVLDGVAAEIEAPDTGPVLPDLLG